MPSRSLLLAGLITVTIALLASPTQAQTCSPAEVAKLLPADGAAFDLFGISVSISGDTAVIGALGADNNGLRSGSAYVFRFNGSKWVQQAELTASDGEADDAFGASVSISGDTAVIGANGNNDNGDLSGSAYVFRFNGSDWVQEAKLTASDGKAADRFGSSISVTGDTAVIGSPFDDDNGNASGAAYIFRFNGTNWAQEAKLLASDGAAFHEFGNSVSVSADTAVIGAFRDDDNGIRSGSAYVFRFDGAGWVQAAKLTASDGAGDDQFGAAVTVSGDTVIIGTSGDDDNGTASGSAYVFRYDGTGWVQEAKLLPDDGAADDFFGFSVSVSGDTAVIGAFGDDDNEFESGSAYVYRYDGAGWVQAAKLLADDGAMANFFGRSVLVSGDNAVIGAFGDDDNGSFSGSAYVFDLNCMTVCLPDVNHDGMLTPTDFTAWINAFNNNLPECDQNGDGSCTPTDFTAWIANFNAGC